MFLGGLLKKYIPTSRSQGLFCILLYRSSIAVPFIFIFTGHLNLNYFVCSVGVKFYFFPYEFSVDYFSFVINKTP